jgi:hypothetical protein
VLCSIQSTVYADQSTVDADTVSGKTIAYSCYLGQTVLVHKGSESCQHVYAAYYGSSAAAFKYANGKSCGGGAGQIKPTVGMYLCKLPLKLPEGHQDRLSVKIKGQVPTKDFDLAKKFANRQIIKHSLTNDLSSSIRNAGIQRLAHLCDPKVLMPFLKGVTSKKKPPVWQAECINHTRVLFDQVVMYPQAFGLSFKAWDPQTSSVYKSLDLDESSGVENDQSLNFSSSNKAKQIDKHGAVLAANKAFNAWALTWRMKGIPQVASVAAPMGVTMTPNATKHSAAISPFGAAVPSDSPQIDEVPIVYPEGYSEDPSSIMADESEEESALDEVPAPDEMPESLAAKASKKPTKDQKNIAFYTYIMKLAAVPRNIAIQRILGLKPSTKVPKITDQVSAAEGSWRAAMLAQVRDRKSVLVKSRASTNDLNPAASQATVAGFAGGSFAAVVRAKLEFKKNYVVPVDGIPVVVPISGQARVAIPIYTCGIIVGCSDIFKQIRNNQISYVVAGEFGEDLTSLPGFRTLYDKAGIGFSDGLEVDFGVTHNLKSHQARLDFVSIQPNFDFAVGNNGQLAYKVVKPYIPNIPTGSGIVDNLGSDINAVEKFNFPLGAEFFFWGFDLEAIGNSGALFEQAGAYAAKGIFKLINPVYERSQVFSLVEVNNWRFTIMNPNYVNQNINSKVAFKAFWDAGSPPYLSVTSAVSIFNGVKTLGRFGDPNKGGEVGFEFRVYTALSGFKGMAFSKEGLNAVYFASPTIASAGGGN